MQWQSVIQGECCPVVCVLRICVGGQWWWQQRWLETNCTNAKSTNCDQDAAKGCGGNINDATQTVLKWIISIFHLKNFSSEPAEKFRELPSMYNPLQITDCLFKMVISHGIQRKTEFIFHYTTSSAYIASLWDNNYSNLYILVRIALWFCTNKEDVPTFICSCRLCTVSHTVLVLHWTLLQHCLFAVCWSVLAAWCTNAFK